jgi:hypothetical protein
MSKKCEDCSIRNKEDIGCKKCEFNPIRQNELKKSIKLELTKIGFPIISDEQLTKVIEIVQKNR